MDHSVRTFAALADPVRSTIVRMLAAGDMAAGDIASRFPVSRPAVSRHLRVLREAGLVSTREEAQQRIYRIEMAAMNEVDGWIAECRRLWAQRLDDFGRHLDRLADKGDDQDAPD